MAVQYRLPQEMRAELSRPLGRLFPPGEIDGIGFAKAVGSSSMVIAVGDRVTETLGKIGRIPELQIVDAKENRKAREPPRVPFAALVKVRNPAGTITMEAIEGIRQALHGKKPARVMVDGEEDLLAIPALVLAPLSASLFYGQPGRGIVMIIADEPTKARNRAIMKRMDIPDIAETPNH
ncbi:MAG: DUF359 domain-containing protein [Nitrososphaerales archaeon]|nr:DUF359 domain-containing protein [Nitrososphaerales archaeon]